MKVLLDGLLPRMFLSLLFQCVPHQGKSDLKKSTPRKLRGWREPGVRFVVIRDNDRGDCMALKEHLRKLCKDRPKEDCLIRIGCQKLEAWFLGDLGTLAAAYRKETLRRIGSRARFRRPDEIAFPAREPSRLVPRYQKISGARALAGHLTRERNQSPSFRALMKGIERLA